MQLQGVLINVLKRRQRMIAIDEQSDFRAFGHGRGHQIWRIILLHLREGQMCATALHQFNQVIAFSDQTF